MKKEDLFEAITDIKDEYIEEVGAAKRARVLKFIKYAGNAAAIIVIFIIVFGRGNFGRMGANREMAKEDTVASTAAVAEEAFEDAKFAESVVESAKATGNANALIEGIDENLLMASPIPEMAKKPDDSLAFSDSKTTSEGLSYDEAMEAWRSDIARYTEVIPATDTEVDSFTGNLIRNFFKGNIDENRIISPINVYFALGMLAETSDGNSRAELLNALGVKDLAGLRNNSLALWNYNFRDDGVATSILGSSIWLDRQYAYKTETLQNLVDYYHSASFSGEMGSESLNQSLHNWMNAQTGGFLKEQIESLSLTRDMITALVTTIYFKDSWIDPFNANANSEMIFKGTNGDKNTVFMNNSKSETVYFGDDYRATSLPMNEGYSMTFIKPNDGLSANELLSKDEVIAFILSEDAAKGSYRPIVELSVPKFDVESQAELTEVLKAMGVSDVFTKQADFTPLTEDTDDILVSNVLHGARVKIDEEGCEAAAYTMITLGATAVKDFEIEEFVLDKPFIYVIRNSMGTPLFVGVINNIG